MSEDHAGALTLLAAAPESAETLLDEARPWLLACTESVHPLPPLLFMVELGRVLTHAPRPEEPPDAGSPQLRRALQRYREHVSSRLVDARALPALRDALATLPPRLRPRAIAATCAAVVSRVGGGLEPPRAAAVRRQLQRSSRDILALAAEALGHPHRVSEAADALDTLASNARRAGRLFEDADVFVLEHFHRLPSTASRLAFQHAAEATSAFERRLPRQMRSRRPSQGEQASALEDESTYPTGGFSSISTSGPLENLVPSELAYIEDHEPVDLFDIRHATSELLKYTRDEGRHRRTRRHVAFILDASMSRARVKDVSAPWQRLTLAVGLIAASVRRLMSWWGECDVQIDLCLPEELEDARQWLELLLHDAIERRQLSLVTGPTEAPDQVRMSAPEGSVLQLEYADSVATLAASDADLDAWLGMTRDLLSALA